MPRAKVSPDWTIVLPSLNTTEGAPSTRSVAVAAKKAAAPEALVASLVWLETGVSVGAVVSTTLNLKFCEVWLPAASTAVAVIVWVPRPNTSPE